MSTAPSEFASGSDAERVAALEAALAETHQLLVRVHHTSCEAVDVARELLDRLEEVSGDFESDLAALRTENAQLRATLEESTACSRQLSDFVEMALAHAAGKGSRAAGRTLATFKAARMATSEARP